MSARWAENLRALWLESGKTQEMWALGMGIMPGTARHWLYSHNPPSLDDGWAVALASGCVLDELLEGGITTKADPVTPRAHRFADSLRIATAGAGGVRRLVNRSGVHKVRIYTYLRVESEPSVQNAQRIAKALNTTVHAMCLGAAG